MNHKRPKIFYLIIIVSIFVFAISWTFLIFGDELAKMYDVIGIRVATLFVAFASFCSTSIFSYLIYNHNKTLRISNEDANKRADLFRDFQFSSNNYSIVELTDSMTIYRESTRYIERFIYNKSLQYHMIDERIDQNDVLENSQNYTYLSVRIPYRVIEGKMVAKISFDRVKFERNGVHYRFITPKMFSESTAYLLYNEHNKTSDIIINLVTKKDNEFFTFGSINDFSKIKINLKITSLLGVAVEGCIELYFTNPQKKEDDDSNIYKINSSNFTLLSLPKLERLGE
jgi:hypothetical protein